MQVVRWGPSLVQVPCAPAPAGAGTTGAWWSQGRPQWVHGHCNRPCSLQAWVHGVQEGRPYLHHSAWGTLVFNRIQRAWKCVTGSMYFVWLVWLDLCIFWFWQMTRHQKLWQNWHSGTCGWWGFGARPPGVPGWACCLERSVWGSGTRLTVLEVDLQSMDFVTGLLQALISQKTFLAASPGAQDSQTIISWLFSWLEVYPQWLVYSQQSLVALVAGLAGSGTEVRRIWGQAFLWHFYGKLRWLIGCVCWLFFFNDMGNYFCLEAWVE